MDRVRWLLPFVLGHLVGCSSAAETGSSTSGDGGFGGPVYVAPASDEDAGSSSADASPPVLIPASDASAPDADALADAAAAPPCASNDDCAADLFCHKATCDDAIGACVPQPSADTCEADQSGAACGCDHVTYPNACWARAFGANVSAKGACVMPAGSCTSQADCGGASYAGEVFCAPASCGESAGACRPVPAACEYLMDEVCGCDGTTYYNECFASFAQVTIAYGGPCRSGAMTACNQPGDCDDGQACVPDPRGCGGSASCPGICVASSGESCGPGCACGEINQPRTQECVATTSGASCVFTSGAECTPDTPCATGQLCLPAVGAGAGGSGQAVKSACVLP